MNKTNIILYIINKSFTKTLFFIYNLNNKESTKGLFNKKK